MRKSLRLGNLKSAVFAELNRIKDEVEAQGLEMIDLGIGSPDRPPAPHVFLALQEAVQDLSNYGYPSSFGSRELRETIAWWYKNKFNVDVDPEKEVLVLMGSQDGLGHLPLCFLDPGDYALIPNPGYPVYNVGVTLAGGLSYPMALRETHGFLPDLAAIPSEVASRAKMMILNYPNNPLAAVATKDFFVDVLDFARRYEITVIHDFAYSELAFDGYKPPSILEIPGAKEIAVEINSVSKTYNMAGCRLGFIVGAAEAIEALSRIKSNIDYGVFLPIQKAGIVALRGPQDIVAQNVAAYRERRDFFVEAMSEIGWHMNRPKATMFLWARLPGAYASSEKFVEDVLRATRVVMVPGVAFGQEGEGYVRIALVQDLALIKEAARRIKEKFTFPDSV